MTAVRRKVMCGAKVMSEPVKQKTVVSKVVNGNHVRKPETPSVKKPQHDKMQRTTHIK